MGWKIPYLYPGTGLTEEDENLDEVDAVLNMPEDTETIKTYIHDMKPSSQNKSTRSTALSP